MQAKYLKLSEKAQKRENAPLAIRLIGSIFKRDFFYSLQIVLRVQCIVSPCERIYKLKHLKHNHSEI